MRCVTVTLAKPLRAHLYLPLRPWRQGNETIVCSVLFCSKMDFCACISLHSICIAHHPCYTWVVQIPLMSCPLHETDGIHNWSPTSFLPKYINFSLHASVQRSTLAMARISERLPMSLRGEIKLRTVPFYCQIDLPFTELKLNLSRLIVELRLLRRLWQLARAHHQLW